MIQKIDKNLYYKENKIQLMIPIKDNCTFIGLNGIKFHRIYTDTLIDDYLNDNNRFFFPFHDVPFHKDEHGEFANQLLELNKPYLLVYKFGGEYSCRADYLFEKNGNIYLKTEFPTFQSLQSKMMSKDDLKKRFKDLLSSYNLIYVIDDYGELHEFNKNKAFRYLVWVGGQIKLGKSNSNLPHLK